MKRMLCCCILLAALAGSNQVQAFGPKGHRLVGAIADQVLAGKSEQQNVSALLKGNSLERIATIPDEIKSWHGNPDLNLWWSNDPDFFADLKDFLLANSNAHGGHGHNPDHHSFHFTDISINSDLKYSPDKHGAGNTDIVHTINYCIGVLDGTIPESNQRKITKRVAVIYLAHLLGDIHQPLHVGAVYFDGQGKMVDPDKVVSASADQGGNDIELQLAGSNSHSLALHAFWDDNSVDAAIREIRKALPGRSGTGDTLSPAEIKVVFVDVVATNAAGGNLDQGVARPDLAVSWANEILPIAEAAHARLTIKPLIPPQKAGFYTFFWQARELPGNNAAYLDYSGAIVHKSIHRGGWRLARLLADLF